MKKVALRILEWASVKLRETPLTQLRWLNRLQALVVIKLHGRDWVCVGPFRVYFRPDDRVHSKRLILYGGHENREIELLCSLLEVGDCVMDVGANIGIHSLHFSRAVGPDGSVVSVEPDPVNVEYLEKNLQSNECENVAVVEAAIGEQSGSVELFLVKGHPSNSSLADLQETGTSVKVRMRRGDEILLKLGLRPRLVKIDVEGFEPQVYGSLGYVPQLLMVECVPEQLRALDNDPLAFLRQLIEDGYSLWLIPRDERSPTEGKPEEIVAATERATGAHNVLAIQDTRQLPAALVGLNEA